MVTLIAPLRAQHIAPASHAGFGLTAGVLSPSGSVGSLHEAGVATSAFVDWFGGSRRWGARLEGSYGRLFGRTISVGPATVSGSALDLFGASVNVVFMSRPRVFRLSPYFMAGAGVYHTTGHRSGTTASTSVIENDTSTQPGFDVGGGLEWRFARVQLFLEARFVDVRGGTFDDQGARDGAHYVPIAAGLRIGSD